MIKFVATLYAVLFGLMACASTPEAPIVTPPQVPAPWLGPDFPYRVSVSGEMSEDVQIAALDAIWTINNTAGAELLRVTDEDLANVHIHYGSLSPNQRGYTACHDWQCEIVTNEEGYSIYRELGWGPVMFLHEYMHLLGYAGPVDGVHDTEGLMARGPSSDTLSERHVEYLKLLAAAL